MNKKKNLIMVILLLAGVSILFSSMIQQETAKELFEKALYLEETKGDLEKAIEVYKQVVKKFPDERATAAKSQLHIGLCYEKLGKREAQKAYEDVLTKYADQLEFVSKARERLAALRNEAAARSQDSRLTIRRVPELDMYAKPSPNGKYFSYVDWETGNLAVLEVETGAKRLLTKDGSWGDTDRYAEGSAWSPDSKWIAFNWCVMNPKETRVEFRVVSLDKDSLPTTIELLGEMSADWIIDWLPDGSRILCKLNAGRRSSKLALVDIRSYSVEILNTDLDVGGFMEQFTKDGESILYSYPAAGKGTSHDIYLWNLKTGEKKAIVEHPSEDLLIGILPGTDWLLFASNRRGRLDLWGVLFRKGKAEGPPILIKQGIGRFYPLGFTSAGQYYYATLSVTDDVFLADFDPETQKIIGEPRKLTSPWEGTNMYPSFSPDGKSLAYVTKRGPMPIPTHSADSLVVQSLEDANADPVVVGFDEFHLTHVADPCWTADGKSLVLAGWQAEKRGIFRVDLTDMRGRDIYWAPKDHKIGFPVCSGTTDSVYFVSGGDQTPFAVIRIDIEGPNEREVFRAPEGQRITSIALSPDEKTLSIITRLDRYRRALLLMPLEGGTPRRIHEFLQPSGGVVTHTWSPNGKSIFYWIKEKEDWTWGIRRIPVDGGGASEVVLKRKEGPSYGISFHPNGRMFAFTGRNGASDASEVWVMENLREEIKMLASKVK